MYIIIGYLLQHHLLLCQKLVYLRYLRYWYVWILNIDCLLFRSLINIWLLLLRSGRSIHNFILILDAVQHSFEIVCLRLECNHGATFFDVWLVLNMNVLFLTLVFVLGLMWLLFFLESHKVIKNRLKRLTLSFLLIDLPSLNGYSSSDSIYSA